MTSPETIQQAVATLYLRWDGDDLDWESERRAIIEVTNGVGELFLPKGRQGDQGRTGDPGPGLAPDLVVDYATDAQALASLPVGDNLQRGFCIVNDRTKTAFFWNGTNWLAVTNAVGMRGDTGATVSVSVGTVTTSATGSAASVSLNGASTPTNRIFDFTLPRGQQGIPGVGIQGPPGDALRGASDVVWPDGGPADGTVPTYNAELDQVVFAVPTGGATGPYGAGPNEITAVNDSSWPADYKQIHKLDIPAQPFAWHPRVNGQVDVRVGGQAARVDLEARLNSVGGTIIGRGPGSGLPGEVDQFVPRVLSPTFEAAITPESATALIAAGQPASVYFSIRRIDTLATFAVATRKDRAGFVVYCDPAPGA